MNRWGKVCFGSDDNAVGNLGFHTPDTHFTRGVNSRLGPFTHSLDEPIYIVEPHPPGSVLVPTGLPAFTVNYVNDDDADRKLGTDSRLLFTARQKGTYFVRITDTRGHGGERFVYRLWLREAKPDFRVTLNSTNPAVSAGAGAPFTLRADRIDGFDAIFASILVGCRPVSVLRLRWSSRRVILKPKERLTVPGTHPCPKRPKPMPANWLPQPSSMVKT